MLFLFFYTYDRIYPKIFTDTKERFTFLWILQCWEQEMPWSQSVIIHVLY
mgnify:CR=1 FL=1